MTGEKAALSPPAPAALRHPVGLCWALLGGGHTWHTTAVSWKHCLVPGGGACGLAGACGAQGLGEGTEEWPPAPCQALLADGEQGPSRAWPLAHSVGTRDPC